MSIKDNLEIIRSRISEAEKKAGRPNGSVKLMAVSKFHPSEAVVQAYEAGQLLFGENRVQEASEKFPPLISQHADIEVHMIGQLQSNKVKKAVEFVSCIQSVDRYDLLKEIEKQASKLDKKIKILFEIQYRPGSPQRIYRSLCERRLSSYYSCRLYDNGSFYRGRKAYKKIFYKPATACRKTSQGLSSAFA